MTLVSSYGKERDSGMFLNGKKFYMELQGYYQKENYEGAEKYLEEKSRELKCMVMPASGLG